LFSLPPEVRHLIYENLLLSPLPLPPTPPQSEQHVFTNILRANHKVYAEAVDILYTRNMFTIHLRSALHRIAYEPFLSELSAENAAKIKELEIILWGNYNENDGDTISFGTESFGIALKNLIYAPKLVVSIDIIRTRQEEEDDDDPGHGRRSFCAFDWLMATFANEWFFANTYFDLFRGIAKFHMNQTFVDRPIRICEGRWFTEARAEPGEKENEEKTLWELEERYGIPHDEENEYTIRHKGEEGAGTLEEGEESESEEEEKEDSTDDEEEEEEEEEGNDDLAANNEETSDEGDTEIHSDEREGHGLPLE
jgi:hypothetical protein